jgi:GMP synthase-like glutamine amidotransferase
VLETGAPPAALAHFGDYAAMFRALLGTDGLDHAVYDVRAGRLPDRIEACAGYVVTGSACGVYDPEPWIAPLEDWLRAVLGRSALIGICFGHQIMAQAFGGQVVKSPKGWGLGAHRYDVNAAQSWMGEVRSFVLPAAHQDQVVVPPPGAEIVAGSDFCPFGMLAYPGRRAWSLQLHPEFTADYDTALIERRRGNGLDDAQAEAALASLAAPMDNRRVAGWIRAFVARAG